MKTLSRHRRFIFVPNGGGNPFNLVLMVFVFSVNHIFVSLFSTYELDQSIPRMSMEEVIYFEWFALNVNSSLRFPPKVLAPFHCPPLASYFLPVTPIHPLLLTR
ncbi:hypothetical protein VIGAN_06139900 [Vigna angularis var. angularis]|uniref:Uncharacterized protein n=1 Tax=Vigna angularis var. angularis TaxID=157739 RepID=A0A0S3SBS6_PHAAN|nr:hypothetical protein VIGAN_06139900 [Vigna angularis var. angularis]